MAVDQFRDMSWQANEPITKDKANTMTSNIRYLFERSPRMNFNAYGLRKTSGIKVAAGTVVLPAKKATSQTVRINFGSFFTTGCKPVITTGIVSPRNGRIVPTMYGLSGQNHVPDHRGAIVRVSAVEFNNKTNYFLTRSYVQYIAVGW